MRVLAPGLSRVDDSHVYGGKTFSNVLGELEGPPAAEAAFVHVYLQVRQANVCVLLPPS